MARGRFAVDTARRVWIRGRSDRYRHADSLPHTAAPAASLRRARLACRKLSDLGGNTSGGAQPADVASNVRRAGGFRHCRSLQRFAMTLLRASLITGVATVV